MYYGSIKKYDVANGPGVRISLFVSGCRNHCKDCFNIQTWDFLFGKEFTKEVEDDIIASLKLDYINGLTILGGEPFEEENQKALLPFIKRVKEEVNKSIWIFSGYVFDKDIYPLDGRKHTEYTNELLSNVDVLVDGPFVTELKKLKLYFRGSSNQRIIDMKKTLSSNQIVLSEWNNDSIY